MPAPRVPQMIPMSSEDEVISPSNLSALARSDPYDNLVNPLMSWKSSVVTWLLRVGAAGLF